MTVNRKVISVTLDASKLKERNRELSILIEMSNFPSSSMRLQDLMTGALYRVLEYFNLEPGRVYLMRDGDQYLRLATHKGMDTTGLEKVSIYGSFSGKAFRTKTFIAQHFCTFPLSNEDFAFADYKIFERKYPCIKISQS